MRGKHFVNVLTIFLISTNSNFAQDDFKKWLANEKKDYQKFLSEEDKNFVEFLQKDWKEFQLFHGLKFDDKPKPVKIPVFEPPKGSPGKTEKEKQGNLEQPPEQESKETPGTQPGQSKEPAQPAEKIPGAPTPKLNAETPRQPVPKPVSTGEILKIDPIKNSKQITIDYFGTGKQILLDPGLKIDFAGEINNKSIGDFWGMMGSKNYPDLLKQLSYFKDQMQLNDWGYCVMLNKIGEELYPKSRNQKHLFIWFMLNKSGYKAKVGLIGGSVFLFIPTNNKLYGVPYFTATGESQKQYVINFDNLESSISGSLYTYDGDYAASVKILDMNIYQPPAIGDNIKEVELSFYYEGQKYIVPVHYNKSIIDFYEYYPYSNLDVYFNSAVSEETKESLIKSLVAVIKDKSMPTAANMLLRFVQTAFEYKTDQPNFGREKPLFREETIYYPYSDCEDRSILFSYLVKNLLNLEVIGLDYPGHIATAVKFNVDVPGDYLDYKGKKFTICDPTYINAYIGMCMPDYKNAKLEAIIELD